eukprot:4106989-Pyramimonas_sp.AAC.1
MEPSVLAVSGWLEAAQAVAAAPAEPARRPAGRAIDSFVVSRLFREAKALVIHGLDLSRHFPVALELLGAVKHQSATPMRSAKRLPQPRLTRPLA